MKPTLSIRHAFPDDVPAMLEVYRPFVENTTFTFEYEVPSLFEFRRRFDLTTAFYPWLVCLYDGIIVGYAYASRHHERAAYQWNADLSIYINPDYSGKHIGTSLYKSLLRLLRLQGFLYVHALVTLPNDKSLHLHKKHGFHKTCVSKNIGFKLGKWIDVANLCLSLTELPENPTPPEAFRSLDPYAVVSVLREEASHIIYP